MINPPSPFIPSTDSSATAMNTSDMSYIISGLSKNSMHITRSLHSAHPQILSCRLKLISIEREAPVQHKIESHTGGRTTYIIPYFRYLSKY